MNKVQRHQLGMAVSAGVLLSAFAVFAVGNMQTFFGIYIPKEMVYTFNSALPIGFVGLALSLHSQRKNPEPKQVVRTLLWFLAYALFVIGWRFAAGETGMVSSANDGFTVTGGFMMLASGLLVGYLFAKREQAIFSFKQNAHESKGDTHAR